MRRIHRSGGVYRGKPGAEQCAGYTGVGEFTAVNHGFRQPHSEWIAQTFTAVNQSAVRFGSPSGGEFTAVNRLDRGAARGYLRAYRGKPGCGEIRFAEWGGVYRGKPGAEQCAGYTGVGEFTAVNHGFRQPHSEMDSTDVYRGKPAESMLGKTLIIGDRPIPRNGSAELRPLALICMQPEPYAVGNCRCRSWCTLQRDAR